VKTRLAIAVAIGAFVSILSEILGTTFRNTLFQYLVLPGHIAIIAIFGAHASDDVAVRTFEIVGTLANIVVYSLVVFAFLTWLRKLR
jgi:hypothetical protein